MAEIQEIEIKSKRDKRRNQKDNERKSWLVPVAVTAVIVLSIVAAFFPFWEDVFKIFNSNDVNLAHLRVYTPEYQAKVYIDDEEKGLTEDGSLFIADVKPGDRNVKLVRESDPAGLYLDFERELYFEAGTEVEIQWIAGPNLQTSEGVVKYLKRQPVERDHPTVSLVVDPANADVFWDNQQFEQGTYTVLVEDSNQHKVKVEADDYETKEFNVQIGDEIRSNNLDQVVEVYLYQIPLETN